MSIFESYLNEIQKRRILTSLRTMPENYLGEQYIRTYWSKDQSLLTACENPKWSRDWGNVIIMMSEMLNEDL